MISPGDIGHNTTFWSQFSMPLSEVTLKIRSRSQSPNQGFSMSKCYIHANFSQNQFIGSGVLSIISLFGLNLACFCLQWPWKLGQGHKVLISFLLSTNVIYMQISAQIYRCFQEILSIISFFGLNLACFCLQWPWKLGQGHKVLIRDLACQCVVSMQILVKIQWSAQDIVCIY